MANIGVGKAVTVMKSYMIGSFKDLAKIEDKMVDPSGCLTPKCRSDRRRNELRVEKMDTLIITALTVADKNGDRKFSAKELKVAKEFAQEHYKNLCKLPKGKSLEGPFFKCLNDFFKKHTAD